jgi:hypothetical protein
VITRNSYGPSIGGFNYTLVNSTSFAANTIIPWEAWADYPLDHTTLGCWQTPEGAPCQSDYFGYTTSVGGCAAFPGTKTLACFGQQGTQNAIECYGVGTTDWALHGLHVPGEEDHIVYCYDPYAPTVKANHQYPRKNFVWLFNRDDLVAAHNGTKAAWEVVPYSGGYFSFPDGDGGVPGVPAVDYDPATNRLFVIQYGTAFTPCCYTSNVTWIVNPNLPE